MMKSEGSRKASEEERKLKKVFEVNFSLCSFEGA